MHAKLSYSFSEQECDLVLVLVQCVNKSNVLVKIIVQCAHRNVENCTQSLA